jgi:hypothetical protein
MSGKSIWMTSENAAKQKYREISRGIWIVVSCITISFLIANIAGGLVPLVLYKAGIEPSEFRHKLSVAMAWIGAIPFVFLLVCAWGVWRATIPFPSKSDTITKIFGTGIRVLFTLLVLDAAVLLPMQITEPDRYFSVLEMTKNILTQTVFIVCILEILLIFIRSRQLALTAVSAGLLLYFIAILVGIFEPFTRKIATSLFQSTPMPAESGVDIVLAGLNTVVGVAFLVLLLIVPVAVKLSLRSLLERTTTVGLNI